MKTSDFYYDLPPEMIAQTPIQRRDSSRLMTLNRETGAVGHRHFYELPELLRPGDCLILNDSRVLPARLLGLSQGAVFRVAGRYRYKILIKTVRSPRSRELFSGFLESAGRELPRGMGVFIDPHYDSGF